MKKLIKNSKLIILLSILYFTLGILFTYPLIKKITTHIPNNLYTEANHTHEWGDHLQIIAGFNEQGNIVTNMITGEEIYNKEFCLDEVNSCKLDNISKIKYSIFSPYWVHSALDIIFTDTLTYNLSILLSFVATGLSAYILASYFLSMSVIPDSIRDLKKGKSVTSEIPDQVRKDKLKFLIAFTASLFPVLAPIRIHHLLVGHKNGFLLPLLILMIFWVEKFIKNKNKLLYQALISITLLYFSFTESFYVFYGLMFIGLRLVWHEITILLSPHSIRGSIKSLIIDKDKINNIKLLLINYLWFPIATALVFIAKKLSTLKSAQNSTVSDGRPFELIEFYSPKISQLYQNGILEHEHNIYLGMGLLVLLFSFIIVLLSFSRKRESQIKSQRIDSGSKSGMTEKKFTIHHSPFAILTFYFLISVFFLLIALGSNTPLYKLMYDYLPTFKFSRTPVRAIFMTFAFLPILFTLIANHLFINKSYLCVIPDSIRDLSDKVLKKFRINSGITSESIGILFCIIFSLITIISFYPSKPISLTQLPNTQIVNAQIDNNQKVLFLPITDAGNFFGSVYEYYLSTDNYVSMNGYHPLPSNEITKFEENYMERINKGELNKEELNQIINNYQINNFVILKEMVSDNTVEHPFTETRPDLKGIEKMFSDSNLEKVYENKEVLIYNTK